ncbi:hypothetical protein RI367_003820 [Sorochytrium milnesiophthora]
MLRVLPSLLSLAALTALLVLTCPTLDSLDAWVQLRYGRVAALAAKGIRRFGGSVVDHDLLAVRLLVRSTASIQSIDDVLQLPGNVVAVGWLNTWSAVSPWKSLMSATSALATQLSYLSSLCIAVHIFNASPLGSVFPYLRNALIATPESMHSIRGWSRLIASLLLHNNWLQLLANVHLYNSMAPLITLVYPFNVADSGASMLLGFCLLAVLASRVCTLIASDFRAPYSTSGLSGLVYAWRIYYILDLAQSTNWLVQAKTSSMCADILVQLAADWLLSGDTAPMIVGNLVGASISALTEYVITRPLEDIDNIHIPLQIRGHNASSELLFAPDYPVPDEPLPHAFTLGQYLQQHKLITIDQALVLLRHLAVILGKLHAHGVVHCNISPDTILLQSVADDWVLRPHDWTTTSVSLCNFSHARRPCTDVASPSTVNLRTCGDPRFMSPESTGRTNRAVDGRSDLYSLGMLVTGALTGSMPSTQLSILKLVHYHVAVKPPALMRPSTTSGSDDDGDSETTPATLKARAFQKILDCMTAKLPEQRFRKCSDLLHALDTFASLDGNLQTFSPQLSTTEVDLLQLLDSGKLYEREQEKERLCQFQQTVYEANEGGLAVVKGSSGVGKTVLVHELMLPACALGGLFCSGKYEAYKGELPYSAFVQACSDLVNLLLVEDQNTVTMLTKTISMRLGDNLFLMLNMLPNLHYLMAAGHALPETTTELQQMLEEKGNDLKELQLTPATVYPNRILQRLQKSFATLLAVVSEFRPLTLFLDDMQWADRSSLKLITELLTRVIPRRLLLVFAYRVNDLEEYPMVAQLEKKIDDKCPGILYCEETLSNLSIVSVKHILSDLLGAPTTETQTECMDGFSLLVHSKTLGNAFYVRRFLQLTIERQVLRPATAAQSTAWSWDEEQGEEILPFENVIGMLVHQQQSFPALTRFVLATGALLGCAFELTTLANMLKLPRPLVAAALKAVVTGGYLCLSGALDGECDPDADLTQAPTYAAISAAHRLPGLTLLNDMRLVSSGTRYHLDRCYRPSVISKASSIQQPHDRQDSALHLTEAISAAVQDPQVRCRWTHDALLQSATELIAESESAAAYYMIGCWLLQGMLSSGDDDAVFDIVHHFGKALALLDTEQKQLNYAKLLLVACSKARTRLAYDSALFYAQQAVELIDLSKWTEQYHIAFRAYHSLITSEHDSGRHDDMARHIDLVLQQPLRVFHQAMLFELKVHMCLSLKRNDDAIEYAEMALQFLGFSLQKDQAAMDAIVRRLPVGIEDIRNLKHHPNVTDMTAEAALRIAGLVIPLVWACKPDLFPAVTLFMVDMTMTYGTSEFSAMAYTCFTVLPQVQENQPEVLYEYSRLANAVMEMQSPTHLRTATTTLQFTEPLFKVADFLRQTIQTGTQWLSSDQVPYTASLLMEIQFHREPSLINLRAEGIHLVNVANVSQTTGGSIQGGASARVLLALVKNLLSRRAPPVEEFLVLDKQLQEALASDQLVQLTLCTAKSILYLFTDDIASAMECHKQVSQLRLMRIPRCGSYVSYLLWRGIVLARHLMVVGVDGDRDAQQELQSIIAQHEQLVQGCEATFKCRLDVLVGCMQWLTGDNLGGLMRLDLAIQEAKEQRFVYLEAIGHELISRLWLRQGQKSLGVANTLAAQQAYRRWGAYWKADMLGQRITTSPVSDAAADATTAQDNLVDEVDLETIQEWTMMLVSERGRDGLLRRTMETAVLYSGSREGILLWAAEAEHADDSAHGDALPSEPKNAADLVCYVMGKVDDSQCITTYLRPTIDYTAMTPLINYVLRTRETLTADSPVITTFVQQGTVNAPHGSFIMSPIVSRGKCTGVLYLSNMLTAQSPAVGKPIKLLRLLLSQLVISLENMLLLDQLRARNQALQAQAVMLESMVQQRTKDLADTNEELRLQVAERKKAEVEARQAASSNRAFLHNMSHELRTPLNCIIGMAELLMNASLTPSQQELCRPLLSSALDLLQIVNNVLDLGKIQASKLSLTLKRFSMRESVDSAIESVAHQASQKPVTLVADYPTMVPFVLFSDGPRIGQVLRNLLSNAVKFTEQGEIVLRVSAEAVASTPGMYVFTVTCTDTGHGIREDQKHLLFKEFSQLDSLKTCKQGGTGLGLSISKGIAELLSDQHNEGSITCESEFGHGSTFTFTFQSKAKVAKAPLIELPPALCILVCHPQPSLCRMLQGYLTFGTHQVVQVSEQGLEKAVQDMIPQVTYVFVVAGKHAHLVPKEHKRIVVGDTAESSSQDNQLQQLRMPFKQSELIRKLAALFGQTVSEEATSQATARPQFKERVLVVEDNKLNRMVATRFLQQLGVQPATAENGEIAVNMCKSDSFDIVLMDGIEATKNIRQHIPADRQPKIVALTANAFEEDKVMYMSIGMDDVLTKPLQLDNLQAALLTYFTPTST